jgi:hypothetical protein
MEQIINNDHNVTTLGNVIVMDVEELDTCLENLSHQRHY